MYFHARLAVGTSFLLVSSFGASGVFLYWADQSLGGATGRAALFVGIMACVHLAGYLLYVGQLQSPEDEAISGQNSSKSSAEYWPALRDAAIVQVVLGVLSALLLDGGRTLRYFTVALIGQWIVALLIIGRRPRSPTELDVIWIRWGIFFVWLLTAAIAPYVWSLIGESYLNGWERLLTE